MKHGYIENLNLATQLLTLREAWHSITQG